MQLRRLWYARAFGALLIRAVHSNGKVLAIARVQHVLFVHGAFVLKKRVNDVLLDLQTAIQLEAITQTDMRLRPKHFEDVRAVIAAIV